MSDSIKAPSIYDYIDFRRYIGDYLFFRRNQDLKFSIRVFTKTCGLPLSNSSFFSKVISGKRNITIDLQFKIAKAMKLDSNGIAYFTLLVRFGQSKDPESKNQLYSELGKYVKSKAKIITKDGYTYYSKWQNAILRAYFGINQNEKNSATIGMKIFPQIPAKEVDTAVGLLLDLGLIAKTANGYTLQSKNIATERENQDFVGKIRIFEMLKLAQEVFNHIPPKDRDFSAMTIFISQNGFQAIQEKIHLFREELKAIIASDKNEDRIYTLGIQLFPNSVLPNWGKTHNSPSPKKLVRSK